MSTCPPFLPARRALVPSWWLPREWPRSLTVPLARRTLHLEREGSRPSEPRCWWLSLKVPSRKHLFEGPKHHLQLEGAGFGWQDFQSWVFQKRDEFGLIEGYSGILMYSSSIFSCPQIWGASRHKSSCSWNLRRLPLSPTSRPLRTAPTAPPAPQTARRGSLQCLVVAAPSGVALPWCPQHLRGTKPASAFGRFVRLRPSMRRLTQRKRRDDRFVRAQAIGSCGF